MREEIRRQIIDWADKYNDPVYFAQDPISFVWHFAGPDCPTKQADSPSGASKYKLMDVEIAAVFASHFAWGRRDMIVRDCGRLFDQMQWRPYEYVMSGEWRSGTDSIHRTIKWDEIAGICGRLRSFYLHSSSLESLTASELRETIFAQKPNVNAANKKINLMRRWLVRADGKVDIGLWKSTDPAGLIIPLDTHVHAIALELGLTQRHQTDFKTALEITEGLREVFPSDPVKGDYALFGYGVEEASKR